ncbi:MAG: hypothetical protein KVP17_004343 [Porospora cf. gigantea B]|uniref:uncharacterized protein n=1 Tax=Porospora cf. gigantea B TaxID=2853592 RepID=UPI003571D7B8|nr:MAG: hypothetical protein KVP17_004343 [Porospora cf. gigantea B]
MTVVTVDSVLSPPKPDEKSLNQRIDDARAAVEAAIEKRDALNERIRELSGGQEDFNATRDELRAEVASFNAELNTLEDERKGLTSTLDALMTEERQSRARMQDQSARSPRSGIQEIDARITQLQRTYDETNLTAYDEKKLVKEIARLRSSRPKALEEMRKADALTTVDNTDGIASHRDRLTSLREEISGVREKRAAASAKLNLLLEARQRQMDPIRHLLDERAALTEDINTAKISLYEAEDTFVDQMRSYQAHQFKIKQAKLELKREEEMRAKIASERARLEADLGRMSDMNENVKDPEHAVALRLTEMISNLVSSASEQTSPEDSTCSRTPEQLPEGFVQSQRRGRETLTLSKRARKNQKAKSKVVKRQTVVLNHDMDTLADFARAGVAPPVTEADVPKCLEQLRAVCADRESATTQLIQSAADKRAELQKRLDALVKRGQDLEERIACRKQEG